MDSTDNAKLREVIIEQLLKEIQRIDTEKLNYILGVLRLVK